MKFDLFLVKSRLFESRRVKLGEGGTIYGTIYGTPRMILLVINSNHQKDGVGQWTFILGWCTRDFMFLQAEHGPLSILAPAVFMNALA